MKLDKLTKQRIDKWFSEVTPAQLLYISKKYLHSNVIGESKKVCDFEHHNADIRRAYTCSVCGSRKIK